MFKEGQLVQTIGIFQVIKLGDEFVELDAFSKGTPESFQAYEQNGFKEVTAEGDIKEFDGFQVGDFFALAGEFRVIRSNEIFTKIDCAGQMLSLPNHKLMGVE